MLHQLRLSILATSLGGAALGAQSPDSSASLRPGCSRTDTVGAIGAMAGLPCRERGAAISFIDARAEGFTTAPSLPIALQARVPGVSVSQGQGFLGSSSRVWLRGPGSLMVNEPLVIIDGARTHAAQPFRGFEEREQPSRLEDIDPEMIERVEVLSGIAAAAAYGPGASRGVILVTTRRARPGPARWAAFVESGPLVETTDFPANFGTLGVSTSTGLPVASCYLAAQAAGSCTPTTRQSWNPLENASPFRTGWTNSAGLSVSGGTHALSYFVSGNHDRGTGVYETDRARATNARLGLSIAPTATIDLSLTGGYRSERLRHPSGSYILAGMLGESVDDPVRRGYATASDGSIERGRQDEEANRTTVALNAVWRPRSWLRTSAIIGYDRIAVDHEATIRVEGFPPTGNFTTFVERTEDAPATQTAAVDATASYGFAGMAMRSSIGIQYFRDDDRASSFEGTEPPGGSFARSSLHAKRTNTGLYLQHHLGWRDRVFVTGLVRADRPGKVPIDDAFSQSVDVSWIAIDSSSAASTRTLTGLRLRASYGRGGGHLIQSAERDDSFFGIGPSSETAERVSGIEVGADASLFADRVWIGLTGYRATNDQGLILTTIPPSGGAPNQILLNDARIRTSGVEGSIDARLLQREGLAWDLGFVLSAHDNEIRHLPGPPFIAGNRQYLAPGSSIGEYRLGSYSYVDANGDGLIAPNEVTVSSTDFRSVGSPFPEYEAGLRTTVAVGARVRLSALLDRRGGQKLYDRTSEARCRGDVVCVEQHDPATSLAAQARAVAARSGFNGAYIESADYTKLREVRLAVSLPRGWAAAAGASDARVTISGRNLFTWSSFGGLDPEITSDQREGFLANSDFFQPPLRSFIARLDLSW